MQNRIGPNKAGPFGLLQTLADGMKLIFKEDLLPTAPTASCSARPVPRLRAGVPRVVGHPARRRLQRRQRRRRDWFGHQTRCSSPTRRSASCSSSPCLDRRLRRSCSPAGRAGRSTRCSARCGRRRRWSATRPRSVSAWRRAALLRHAVDVRHRAGQDASCDGTSCPRYRALRHLRIAATAELNRPPFDLVEAEQELVGGFNTEYSAFSFALFFLAEFMNAITMSAVIVTLFLGGPQPVAIGGSTARHPVHQQRPSGRGLVRPQAVRCSSTCSCGSGPRCPACATTS